VSKRFSHWFIKPVLLVSCVGVLLGLPVTAIAGMNEARAAANAGDYDTAYIEFKPLAEQGDPYAQYMLGLMHMHGKGAAHNSRLALMWFGKSADQGFADSLFNLGVMYTQAVGVAKDYAKGIEFLKKAGERGSAEAQMNLGIIYDSGKNVPQDFQQAALWYQKAAKRGVVPAQFNLGSLFESGQGVTKSEVVAFALYTISMYNGFPAASAKVNDLKSKMKASDIARGNELVTEMVKPAKLTLSLQMSGRPVVPGNLTNALRAAAEKR
jgi:TPR repeat protein